MSSAKRQMIAVRCIGFIVTVAVTAFLGQTIPNQTDPNASNPAPARPAGAVAQEFPLILQQSVTAGKTPVGTKIKAKLTIATLAQGVVIPQDAVFSGEVFESTPKSASEPSRLAISVDSVQWKSGAAPTVLPLATKLYATAWYYPFTMQSNQNGSSPMSGGSASRSMGGPATNPGQNPGQRGSGAPFPAPDQAATNSPFPTSSGEISPHRVLMKNVESTITTDGAVVLTSTHANIRLDKATTYVFAASDLRRAK